MEGSEKHSAFLDACVDAFRNIGVKVTEEHRRYMVSEFNLLYLHFGEDAEYLSGFTRARADKTESMGKKAKKLLDAISKHGETFRDIMAEAYINDLYPVVLNADKDDVDKADWHDAYYKWGQGMFINWLNAFADAADLKLEELSGKRQEGGRPTSHFERMLVSVMAKSFIHFTGDKQTPSNSYPGTTRFSRVVNHVFETMGIYKSKPSIEKLITRVTTPNDGDKTRPKLRVVGPI